MWEHNIDRFLAERKDFIAAERDKAAVPYAFVKDGEWYAKGNVGWWGSSQDTCTDKEWNRRFNEMLDALPEDTPLTVVDCHI